MKMSGSIYRKGGKRLLDVLCSAFVLAVMSPLLLFVWILVYFKLGHPVLFRQMRPGLHGRPFELIKFRTMTDHRNEDGQLLPDAERLTFFGRLLRATSLDELPELWNVLKGEMSMVGPRPLLMEYLPLYSIEQARRHDVKPGITGWAQVNGRNAIEWKEKFRLDVQYVDEYCLSLDLGILCRTVVNVFFRRGITAESHVTMPKFAGNEE